MPVGDEEVIREEHESSRDDRNMKNEEKVNKGIEEKETGNESQDSLSSSPAVVLEENDIRSDEGFTNESAESQNEDQTKLRSMRKDEKEDDPALDDEHDYEQKEENKSVSQNTDETEKPKNFTVKSSNEESGILLNYHVLTFIFI